MVPVKMYFPQMLNTVNDIQFNLTIWDDNNGIPGDTLYSQSVFPVHTENGEFHTYYIKIVEDAAEALGTFYLRGKLKKKHAGTIGDIGCLSFNGNKIITSGGGGMIITNDKKLAEKCKYLSTQATDNSIIYKHDDIGYNYRLTNIQAAVGVAQLEKIQLFIKKKKRYS